MSVVIRVTRDGDIPALVSLRRASRDSVDDPDFEARFAA